MVKMMQSYLLKEIRDRQTELLEQAVIEPVLLLKDSQPKYVAQIAKDCDDGTRRDRPLANDNPGRTRSSLAAGKINS